MFKRLLFLILMLILVAVVVYLGLQNSDLGVVVEVEPASRKASFRSYVTASGEIVATRYADIGSDIMGKIVSLPVVEGQQIKVGQILARIDPIQARADLEGAEAQVLALESELAASRDDVVAARTQVKRAEATQREAQLDLTRMERLFSEGVAPEADLDTARAAFDRSNADVAAALANLERAENFNAAAGRRVSQAGAQEKRALDLFSKTEIRSPMAGVVSRLQVREGEMVVIGIQNQPGTTLMTISDLTGINAEVKVAEADILSIRLGQSAKVLLDAVADNTFDGEVIEIGTSALPSAGSGAAAREFRVVIRLIEPSPGMRPGLTCDAEILTTELQDVIAVPLQSVVIRDVEDEEQTGVFLLEGGVASFVKVKSGVIGGLEIVVEGLEEGSPVITGPFQVLKELQDGDPVQIK
jgi:HlyD family secretion protein